MKRTLLILLTLAGGVLLTPTPAFASADWVPDQVVVMSLPDAYGPGQADLNAKPGDVLDVTWTKDENGLTVPRVGDVVLLPDNPQFAPAGPDSKDGNRDYPTYTVPMAVAHTTLSPPLYDRDPRQDGAKQVLPASEGSLVWASGQKVQYDGSTWVRIGWGVNDAWIPQDALAKADLRDEQQRAWDTAKEGKTSCAPYCVETAKAVKEALCAASPDEPVCAQTWRETLAELCAGTWKGSDDCGEAASSRKAAAATKSAYAKSGEARPDDGGAHFPWLPVGVVALLATGAGSARVARRKQSGMTSKESD